MSRSRIQSRTGLRLPVLALAAMVATTAACGTSSLGVAAVDGGEPPPEQGSTADASSADAGGLEGASDERSGQPQMVLTGGTGSDPFGMGAGAQIYVMNLDGTASRQITDSGAQQNFLPHFSPDGTRLVFTRFMTGSYTEGAAMTQAWDTDVWSYSFATHTETNLTSTPGIEESYPVWSPDGSQIAYIRATEAGPSAVHIMNADGSGDQFVVQGSASWQCCRDIAWSSDNWLISVIHDDSNPACVRSRIDKFRPDGSQITQVSDGGPNCSVATYETAGDADPGFSADGKTIYSSRGFPKSPPGAPAGMPPLTERKLYAFSSEAWYSGKPEQDLSFPSEPDCIEGVPRGSPDGTRVLLFRACFDKPNPKLGAYWASADGKSRTFVATGFAPDWNRAQ